MSRPSARFAAALLLPALLLGAAACSSSGDESETLAGSSDTTATTERTASTEAGVEAAGDPLPTDIPAGTVLRVGDQLDYLQIVLGLAGEDQDLPYTVEYSAFIGGPPMLQAFQAGAIDTGFVGSTPLIFAQAGQQELLAVAGWASNGGGYDLVTAPGVDDIDGWEDLAGRSVAYQAGTAGQSALLQALDEVGLVADDVTPVDLPITQTASALQSGAADAALLVEPLTSVYLAQNPTAAVVDQASLVTDRSSYVIASSEALGDAAKTAALADYVSRLVRAFAYVSEHPEEIAEAAYVGTYGLPAERAAEIVARNGGVEFLTLPDDVADAQQRLADLLADAGVIPGPVDVTEEFDTRFADVIEAARAG